MRRKRLFTWRDEAEPTEVVRTSLLKVRTEIVELISIREVPGETGTRNDIATPRERIAQLKGLLEEKGEEK